jgi:hypothetical protein
MSAWVGCKSEKSSRTSERHHQSDRTAIPDSPHGVKLLMLLAASTSAALPVSAGSV